MFTNTSDQHNFNALGLIIALITSIVNCRCRQRRLIGQFQQSVSFLPVPALGQFHLSDSLHPVGRLHFRLGHIGRTGGLVNRKGHCSLCLTPVAVRRGEYHFVRCCITVGNGRSHASVLPCKGSGYISRTSAQLALRKCLSVGNRCRCRLLRDFRCCLSERKCYHCRRRLIVYIIRRCKDSHIALIIHHRYDVRILPAPASVHCHLIVSDRPDSAAARPDTSRRTAACRYIIAHRCHLAEGLCLIIGNRHALCRDRCRHPRRCRNNGNSNLVLICPVAIRLRMTVGIGCRCRSDSGHAFRFQPFKAARNLPAVHPINGSVEF